LAVATFAVERPARGDAMVIVLEVERRPLIESALLQGRVQAALVARHDVSASEIVIVPAGRIPRTSSGKVRRKEARMLYGSGAFHAMARASVAESGTVMR
jgi:acyl-CoA synthetase (AMP-forming)/AMP-acid ligase II